MDDPLRVYEKVFSQIKADTSVLILVVMDDPLRALKLETSKEYKWVLILVVMDDPLRDSAQERKGCKYIGLNPCCNG